MFTGQVPHGTAYKTIASVAPDYAYLDEMVSEMICQSAADRPASIDMIKNTLIGRGQAFIDRQRISELEQRVVSATDLDDPLVLDPPRLTRIDYQRGVLYLYFQRPVNDKWRQALKNMGNFSWIGDKGPEYFTVPGDHAFIRAEEQQVQQIVDNFKNWLPNATSVYAGMLQREKQEEENARRRQLQKEMEEQEQRLRILNNTKI